jgi:hypothetical protein
MNRLIACALATALLLPAVEIATGKMLGSGYDARSFYVRSGGGQWVKTYSGPQYRPEAAGKLMNLRIAQGIVHDEWLTEAPFDPEAHTSRVIAALDTYKKHGILAINVSLQGANPEYGLSGVVKRDRHYKMGPGKGMHTSAFRPDGSLKPEWMKRALRLAQELDKRGMILNLLYFYGYQDEIFPDTATIDKAVANATDWIIDNKLKNIIIELANESDGAVYDHDKYIHREMGKLIQIVRSRFKDRRAGYTLPISASTLGGKNMRVYEGVRQYADYTALHGNHLTPGAKAARLAEIMADPTVPGPIYMNEDNNGRDTDLATLKLELASCDAVFAAGASWGYMPWRQLQIFPFRHVAPAASGVVRDEMPVEERDPSYFKAVLEHIAKKVFR